jgi:hypothetical protein
MQFVYNDPVMLAFAYLQKTEMLDLDSKVKMCDASGK